MNMVKAIVIGAGSAGMSCALRLQEESVDYLLITDVLGGRICYSEEEKVNFGAYFIMKNYHHASKLVRKETWINPLKVLFSNSDADYFPTLSRRSISLLPQLIRFYILMRKFMKHYSRFKGRCEAMSQREAMKADPFIEKLFYQSASDYIREHKLEKVSRHMVSKFSYACTGVDMGKITALDFLNVSQGLVIPIHRFRFDRQAMEARLGKHLVYDTVTKLERSGDAYLVQTLSGKEYMTENVVLATPAVVTQKLLKLETELRKTCQLYVYHVEASMIPKFGKYEMNVFPFESEIIFTAIQDDGTYLFYTREQEADLKKVCTDYRLLGSKSWEKAMYVYGAAYVEQEYGKGLYVAGDHNGLGLEPTAISGIYAANRICQTFTNQ